MQLSEQTIARIEKQAEDLVALYIAYKYLQACDNNEDAKEYANQVTQKLAQPYQLNLRENESILDFRFLWKLAKKQGINFSERDFLSKTDHNSSSYLINPNDHKAIANLFLTKFMPTMKKVPATTFQASAVVSLFGVIIGLSVSLALGKIPDPAVHLSMMAIIICAAALCVIAVELEQIDLHMKAITTQKMSEADSKIAQKKTEGGTATASPVIARSSLIVTDQGSETSFSFAYSETSNALNSL